MKKKSNILNKKLSLIVAFISFFVIVASTLYVKHTSKITKTASTVIEKGKNLDPLKSHILDTSDMPYPLRAEELPTLPSKEERVRLGIPENLPDDLVRALVTPNPELPDDFKPQLEASPPPLPNDLKKQLEQDPQDLSEEMMRQFKTSNPELPDDLKNALENKQNTKEENDERNN